MFSYVLVLACALVLDIAMVQALTCYGVSPFNGVSLCVIWFEPLFYGVNLCYGGRKGNKFVSKVHHR